VLHSLRVYVEPSSAVDEEDQPGQKQRHSQVQRQQRWSTAVPVVGMSWLWPVGEADLNAAECQNGSTVAGTEYYASRHVAVSIGQGWMRLVKEMEGLFWWWKGSG
jgi:hypothetical protein